MDISATNAADPPALIALQVAAFATPDEGGLVADLITADLAAIFLVAVQQGRIIGHILFGPLIAETDRETALALAALAIHPDQQRRG